MDSALNISHYLIDLFTRENKPVSNMQLQFILYFTYCEYYKITSNELFSDYIWAVPQGISIPSIFYNYMSCGITPICELYDYAYIDNKTKSIIYPIVEKYRKCSMWRLIDEIRQPDGLWNKFYKGYKEIIPKQLIWEYAIHIE